MTVEGYDKDYEENRGDKVFSEQDITSPVEIRIYSQSKFAEIKQRNHQLIKMSKPFLENIFEIVSGTECLVVLTDAEGCILSVEGDESVIESLTNGFDLVEGGQWTEKTVGNTATLLSMKKNEPVQLSGEEHHLKDFHDRSCSSSPIHFDNEVVGALTVVCKADNYHPHTLGMVIAATKAIEYAMTLTKANEELIIKNEYQDAMVDCISDGFLTIDNKGCLTYINKIGAEVLGIDRETSIGKHVQTLVDFDPVILDVLKTHKGYQDKEFIFRDRYGKIYHFIKSATPIFDTAGEIVGVVDSFRKIKDVHTMVKQIIGTYGKFTFDDIIGKSQEVRKAIRLGKVAAKSSSTVLVYGESGTGKEILVQAIHHASARSNESFVSINCAAIPAELVESEMFGYEAGAFTGALKTGQAGKFELANGGTLFLDEIGDMPLYVQSKLLRVLQENKVTRVGGTESFDINVRVICATNKNLLEECEKGNFRHELYYRLNVLNITLPSLRDRMEDLESLCDHFIYKLNKKMSKKVIDISDDALAFLKSYHWPGNIRELENTLERAVNVCDGMVIERQHITGDILDWSKELRREQKNGSEDEVIYATQKMLSLDEVEKLTIEKTLEKVQYNKSKAAEVLGISRNTLYSKIDKHRISAQ